MTASGAVLEIQGLSVKIANARGDRPFAVIDASLSVMPSEIVCVVGESGSGKSVTAQAVMGLLPRGQLTRAKGSIVLEGEELTEASARRMQALRGARMGMIFQEPTSTLNPVVRVGDQVAEVLSIHTPMSRREKRERTLSMLEAVHLPDPIRIASSYPHQLSGGQLQRVMIAQALILDPVLLVADEPTTALDVTTQAQILHLIKEMQLRRGTGVMLITHDFGIVADIADRVVVMRHGEVVETGTTREVLANPQHPYTKALIAAVPRMKPPVRPRIVKETVLTVEKVSKTYGISTFFRPVQHVHALDGASLHVKQGEALGIVGESGSGKSTLARCIVRLVDPDSGSVDLLGTEIAYLRERQLRPQRRHMQIVFQDPYRSLNPRLTVARALIEGPMNFGLSRNDALSRARELIELVGLNSAALDRFPHQFSGGQRQRIAIARALAMEPKILVADEAVSALDVSVQKQVLLLLDDVRVRFNLAVLFITHDLRVAAQFCDRLVVMSKGEIVEQGSTENVFGTPQHSYTKSLIEAAPGKAFPFN